MKKLTILLFSSLVSIASFGQFTNPDAGQVFDDQSVHRVDIIIDQGDLDLILLQDNWYSDEEFPATFVFDQQDTVENIGFRLRGNTSRSSAKKSFKVSFNTYEPGRDYKGLEKMNLNGEHNDPNIMRAKLVWDAARAGGLAAPRCNYVELYINSEYKGLYLNVEHIDEEFVESRFGNKEGNLYKCLWPADLTYQGSNPDNYKFENGDRRTYDLKINEDADDYSDLAHFIDVLNNTSAAELPASLEDVFDVNSYLKTAALAILAGHWDSYTYLKNNYYLYHNQADDRIEYLAYDTDNTLGIDWIGRDWGTRDIYNWSKSDESRPLYERLLANDEYRNRFSFFINEWIEGPFDPDVLNNEIERLRTMIDSSVQADEYRTMDWGFTYDSYLSAFDNALGGHVAYGLKPFISTRMNSAQNQLVLNNVAPIIWHAQTDPIYLNEPVLFAMYAEDEGPISAKAYYRINSGEWQTLNMSQDGSSELYMGQLTSPGGFSALEYYFEATDAQANTSRYPRAENQLVTLTAPEDVSLVINELMAVNDNTVQDEAGEYNDWIELYNPGTGAVWLGDKYLSDKAGNPGKWPLPDMTLAAGEFVLIWADEDGEQGDLHANFKLSGDGEFLRLGYGAEAGFQVIDSVTFGPLAVDQAYGRIPDGTGPFIKVGTATPGSLNLYAGFPTALLRNSKVLWYPNPTDDDIFLKAELNLKKVWVVSIDGKIIKASDTPSGKVSLKNLNPGIYLIKSLTEDGQEHLQRVILK